MSLMNQNYIDSKTRLNFKKPENDISKMFKLTHLKYLFPVSIFNQKFHYKIHL